MPTRPSNPYEVLDEVERVARIGTCEWSPVAGYRWSDNFFRLLGLRPRSVPPSADALLAILGREGGDRFLAALEEAAGTGRVTPWKLVAEVDGSTRTFEVAAGSRREGDGGTAVLATIHDRTEEEERERQLASYAHMLEQAQTAGGIGSYRWDRATGEIWWSPQLYRIMGMPESHRPTVESFDTQVHPDDLDGLRAARAAGSRQHAVRIVRPDGTVRRVRIHGYEVEEPTPVVYGVVDDVTERHELEQRLRSAQTYEAVGRLAAGLAHDFNNLLTVIVGDVALAREATGYADLDGVLRAADQVAALTTRLLSLGRSLQAPLVVTALDEVVAAARETLEEALPDQVRLEIGVGSGALVRAEREQLRQALLNLVVEARDAMGGEGGVIAVRTRRARAGVVVEIEDPAPRGFGGSGDAAPFGSVGLGRAMVLGALANMEGRLEIVESPTGGTIARMWLPPTQAPTSTGDANASPTQLRVLVVEDEPAVRRLAARVLGKAGMEVWVACDPVEAAAMEGPFDVVLSDVVMPEGGGQAVLRDMERRFVGLPVVFMTGYSERAGWLSGQRVLHKPFQPQQLVDMVRAAASDAGG